MGQGPFDHRLLDLVGEEGQPDLFRRHQVLLPQHPGDFLRGHPPLPQLPDQLDRADAGEGPPLDGPAGAPGKEAVQKAADRKLRLLAAGAGKLLLAAGKALPKEANPVAAQVPLPAGFHQDPVLPLPALGEEVHPHLGQEHPQDALQLVMKKPLVFFGKDYFH